MRKSAALALLPFLVSGCSDACQNSLVTTADTAIGDFKAVQFQRNWGVTTGFSSQVSITKKGATPSGPGNVFVADTDHGAARAAAWGGPWVDLRWLSPESLLIRYDAKARVFTQNDRVSDVKISYEKVTR